MANDIQDRFLKILIFSEQVEAEILAEKIKKEIEGLMDRRQTKNGNKHKTKKSL